MVTSRIASGFCLLLFVCAAPAAADQYDDCVAGCGQTVAPCEEQARLGAGSAQEEQDLIAGCEKNRMDCINGCRAADVPTPPDVTLQPEVAPQPQPEGKPQGQ